MIHAKTVFVDRACIQYDDFYKTFSMLNSTVHSLSKTLSRVGNFIIGASGSDKQMLCASSGARAAPIIAVKYCQQKR